LNEDTDWDNIFKGILIASAHSKYDTVAKDEGDLYQITTPSEKASWANSVIHSNFDGLEHRERIATIIQNYRALEVSFKWHIGPGHGLGNLQAVLEEFGLQHKFDCLGMVRSTELLVGKVNPQIEVENIPSKKAKDFVAATMGGWNLPATYHESMCKNVLRQIEGGIAEYFVARDNGRPVGSGILTMFGGFGYLKRGSVVPEYRGKGVFKALMAKRLEVLRDRGISTVLVLAKSDTAAPRCERFGFKTKSRIQYFFEQR